jgi:homoserine O-acetyltransferase
MSKQIEIRIEKYLLPDGKPINITLTGHVYGRPLGKAPVVLINHALTGNSQVAGESGWWKNLIGVDKTIDLNAFTVIAFNIPGNALDPHSHSILPLYKSFTTKVIGDLFWKGLECLNIHRLYAIVGGSLGGGIAWEMAFIKPLCIGHLIPIACSPTSSDWLIANVLVQENILNHSDNPIQDARMHAMLMYRTPESIHNKFRFRFNRNENQYMVESWLRYHGDALKNRFGLQSYKLMNHLLKTIGEDQTWNQMLEFAGLCNIKIHIVAIDTDYLFTLKEQWETYKLLRRRKKDIYFYKINSIHGHDAFLMEYEQLNHFLNPIFKRDSNEKCNKINTTYEVDSI